MNSMEPYMNKIETIKNLADIKHKLVALDGIMQDGFKRIFLDDADASTNETSRETQGLNIRQYN